MNLQAVRLLPAINPGRRCGTFTRRVCQFRHLLKIFGRMLLPPGKDLGRMKPFAHVPGHDGKLLKITPLKGMKGRVSYPNHTGPGIPPDGTEVEVIGPGYDDQHVRVRAIDGGRSYDLGHWEVDCGRMIYLAGEWRPMDDPLAVGWLKANRGEF